MSKKSLDKLNTLDPRTFEELYKQFFCFQGKLTKIKEDSVKGKSVKSSTAFFTQLQSDSQAAVSNQQGGKVKKVKSPHTGKKQVIASNLIL